MPRLQLRSLFTRVQRGLARMRADHDGTALIEFAMILPTALLLYLGAFQLEDAISCNRRVTVATRGIADLVAQNVSGAMDASEIDDNLAAAAQILAPYPADVATVRVTQVTTGIDLKTRVSWSRARNGASFKKNDIVVIPPEMRIPGTFFLFAEVKYPYQPVAKLGLVPTLALDDKLFMIPRNSTKIDCKGC